MSALLLVGQGAVGKTTTVERRAATTIRLNVPAQAAAFEADPDAALRGLDEPVLLDEWQSVPGVLGAVARIVNDDPRAGRFFLAGSVRAEIENTPNGILRDGDLLGRVLDTFVTAQLRPELALSTERPHLHHLRTKGGEHEIDLLLELGGYRIVAIEIKAAAAPGAAAAKHLSWLRDSLGDRFLAGVVLHTGPRVYSLGEKILAAPISTLWAD